VPSVILLTHAPVGPIATRLAAVLAVGSRLSIAAVLLGARSSGATWHVDTDGTARPDGDSASHDMRLNMLDRAAAADILATLQQAWPGDDEPPPSAPMSPGQVPMPGAAGQPRGTQSDGDDAANQAETVDRAEAVDRAESATDRVPPDRLATPWSTGTRLRLTVLGEPAIRPADGDTERDIRIRRLDGRQILVHLAVHPDGVTSDQ
jgi:hypothetical protein